MNVLAVHHFKANTYPLSPGLRLLEASAGTGKTFALAHLVLRLITERQLKLQHLAQINHKQQLQEDQKQSQATPVANMLDQRASIQQTASADNGSSDNSADNGSSDNSAD